MTWRSGAAGLGLLQAVAFWPVWSWYAARTSDGSDEPWGLAALAVAVALFTRLPTSGAAPSPLAGTLTTVAYALAFPFAPPLLRAAFALVAVTMTFLPLRDTGRNWALLGLLLLSLPMMSSLQFYLGHPLRVASGVVAAALLSSAGFAVAADGTCLRFGGQLVAIDAPCSGVRMLWGGTFLALTLAAALRLRLPHALALTLAAAVTVIFANGVRAAALFFPETGILALPGWAHVAIGLVTFAAAAALVSQAAVVLAPVRRPS